MKAWDLTKESIDIFLYQCAQNKVEVLQEKNSIKAVF